MSWWQYLLLVNIYLLLFYGFYMLLLRKETFFQLNRLYLVSAAILSFLIPVIQASWVQNLFITQQVKYTLYNSPVMIYNFKPIEESAVSIGQILFIIYMGGILFLSARLIWQLIKLKKVISQPEPSVSYSFFKTVKLNADDEEHAAISTHEDVHARQWHSADVLLVELVMIINWFNPVVYFYRMAIKHIHEFIADRQAIKAGTNKADYAMLLLSQTFHTPTHNLVNPFFNKSMLKARIMMLQKNNSQRVKLIKYGLSAPLFILMMILSSATINNSDAINVINIKADKVFATPASKVTEITIDEPLPMQDSVAAPSDTTEVFTAVENVPEFPGGIEAFGKFLGTNIKYPATAREQKIQGRVILSFIVEKDGSLSSQKIIRGITDDLNNEALRVIALSPKWKPGVQNGRPVRVQYSVPITFSLAPDDDVATADTVPGIKGKIVSDPVFTAVENVPEFPGGLEAFAKFLATNLKYPKVARDNNVQGRVIITFVVEKDGSLTDMKVVRGIGSGCDEEAVRVLKLSPAWKCGTQNGRPVKVQYSVPISFTLAADDNKKDKPGENKTGAVENGNSSSSFAGSPRVDTAKLHVIIKDLPTFGGTSNQPLYIVDGNVQKKSFVLGTLKPDDIESISVLKGETGRAIYGSKAANGVILIVTKAAVKKKAVKSN